MRIKMETSALKQTQALANSIASILQPGMIVLLNGDLGSGKTTFVKYVVKALGCDDLVTSPTFTLLNTYQARFPIYHFDMYRLSSAEEALNVGFGEYFDKNKLDGLCFVEWPENVEGLIKKADYVVTINKRGDRLRSITIEEAK